MKLTFKQFDTLINLTEDQVTEEKLEEIFGAWFGKKKPEEKTAAVAKGKIVAGAKKTDLQTALKGKEAALAKNKADLAKNAEDWRNWIHSEKNPKKSGISAGSRMDKLPSNRQTAAMARAGERDWVKSLTKEAFEKPGIPYKGYTIKRKDGLFHVMKGPRFIGHGKDHQEAMKVADKDMDENQVQESRDSGAWQNQKAHNSFEKPAAEMLGCKPAEVSFIQYENDAADIFHKVVNSKAVQHGKEKEFRSSEPSSNEDSDRYEQG